jgi:hypothetical protein
MKLQNATINDNIACLKQMLEEKITDNGDEAVIETISKKKKELEDQLLDLMQ